MRTNLLNYVLISLSVARLDKSEILRESRLVWCTLVGSYFLPFLYELGGGDIGDLGGGDSDGEDYGRLWGG